MDSIIGQRLAGIEHKLETIENQIKTLMEVVQAQIKIRHREQASSVHPGEIKAFGHWVITQLGWPETVIRLKKKGLPVPAEIEAQKMAAGRWAMTRYTPEVLREKLHEGESC